MKVPRRNIKANTRTYPHSKSVTQASELGERLRRIEIYKIQAQTGEIAFIPRPSEKE